MAEFRFNNDFSPRQTSSVIDVLRRPRLWIPTEKDYPTYESWLHKVENQITTGAKRAMVAYFGNRAVGTVIYQRHPVTPTMLEIRNISVSPEHGGRYVGSFLLRNSELEAASHDFPGIDSVMVDTKVNNSGMIKFLEDHGYELENVTDLYGDGAGPDAILSKPLAK